MALTPAVAGCGGATSRARAALDAGDAERALEEATRAAERGGVESELLLFDALILSGDASSAREVLAGLTEVPATDLRSRELALAELEGDVRGFAEAWAAGFAAGEAPPVPVEADFLAQVVGRLLGRSQSAAYALLTALPEERLAQPAVGNALDRELDIALYQLYYRREFNLVASTPRTLIGLLGERLILVKHELASRLRNYRSASRSERSELRYQAVDLAGAIRRQVVGAAGDDLAQLEALANDFSTRGAYMAGSAAFEIAASLDPNRAPQWTRGAANAAYLARELDVARELLEESADGAPTPDDLTAAFDVALRHNDEQWDFEFVERASSLPCPGSEFVEVGESLRARSLVASGRAAEAVERVIRRLDECAVPGLAATVGVAVLDAGEVALAEPLLYRAISGRVGEAELVAMYLPVAIEAGRVDRAVEIAERASAATLATTTAVPLVLSMYRALKLHDETAIQEVAHRLIENAVAAEPSVFDFVSELADSHVARDEESNAALVLDDYIASAEDPLIATLGVASWMEQRFDDRRLIAEAYVRVARQPESRRPFDAFDGRSAAEHAWFRAALHYSVGRGGPETAEALWHYVGAAGPGSYGAWDRLWSEDAFFGALQPTDVLALGEVAQAAGLEDSRIQLRLGAAYVAQGADSDARDAYIAALRADPNVIGELMEWLGSLDDNGILIEVLHALPAPDRPYQGWVALANAHASEAANSSATPSERAEHRIDSRQAFWNAIAINPSASFRAQRFSDGGLPDVAAHLHLRDLESNPESRMALQLSLLALAESGAPDEELAPLLDRAVEEFDEAPLSRLRSVLADSGYLTQALRVGRRQLERSGLSTEGLEATASAVTGYAAELRDFEAVRELTDLFFVTPARLLADPGGIPPERYSNVADREGRAAALMGTASRLYESAELWSLAESAALDRLALTESTSRLVVERCLISAIRARGGTLPRAALNTIANAAGGSPQAWRRIATSLSELERAELEAVAWSRVLELVPDDWSAELELGELEARDGRLDVAVPRLERAVAGAAADGRGPETAIYAGRIFAEIGRADLAIELLDPYAESSSVAIELADFEFGAGLRARALRRLSSQALPPAEATRVYLRHGFNAEGVALWESRVAGFTPSIAIELVRARTDALFEQLPFSRALAVLLETAERGGQDSDALHIDTLAIAGRPLGAAAHLERELLAGGSIGDLRDLVALYTAGNAWTAANRAVGGAETPREVLRYALAHEARAGVPEGTLTREPLFLEALSGGEYQTALQLLTESTGDVLPESLPVYSAALAMAGSGFPDEAYALLASRLETGFDVDAWFAALSVESIRGGDEVVARALVPRLVHEPALALTATILLGVSGDLEMAEELLQSIPIDSDDGYWTAQALATAGLFGHQPSIDRLLRETEQPGIARQIWGAAWELGLTEVAVVAADQLPLSDQSLTARFASRVGNGRPEEAYAALTTELPYARAPLSVLREAIRTTSMALHPDLFRQLLDDALAMRPYDIELLIELAAIPSSSEYPRGPDRLRDALDCNPGGTSHAVNALVTRGADAAALTVAEGCEALPVRAEVLLGLVRGSLPDDLEGLQASHAIRYSSLATERGDFAAAERLAAHALVGASPSPRAFASRAIARAGLGDVVAASADSERFLDGAYDLASDGPELLAALASCGAYEAADMVAHSLRRIPSFSRSTSGAALVIQSFTDGSPADGIRYVEQHMPLALRRPVVSGLASSVSSLLDAAGDPVAATTIHERELELDPLDGFVMNNLAYLLTVHTDRHEEARRLAVSSIALQRYASANVLDTLAWSLFHLGSVEEALVYSRQAVGRLPQEAGYEPGSEHERVLIEHLRAIEAASPTEPAVSEVSESRDGRRRRTR